MSAEVLEAEPQPERSYKRLWCAMASAVVPGFGDWILGARKRSSILLALFVTVLLCYWPLRLPRFYWPFIVLILVGQFLNMVSGCCTFLLGRSAKDAAANGWIVIVIVLGLCSVPFERRLELRGSGFQVFTVPSESMAHTINPGDCHRRLRQSSLSLQRFHQRHILRWSADQIGIRPMSSARASSIGALTI